MREFHSLESRTLNAALLLLLRFALGTESNPLFDDLRHLCGAYAVKQSDMQADGRLSMP